jgi:hypothetical protein
MCGSFQYVLYYPKSLKYVSLFSTGSDGTSAAKAKTPKNSKARQDAVAAWKNSIEVKNK